MPSSSFSLLNHTRSGSIAAYIQETVRGEDLSSLKLSALARRFAVSERLLTSAFRARYKTSVKAYVLSERNKYICELLETNMSVKEIAYQLGYSEPCNFTRDFGKRMGMSAGEWRERMREKVAETALQIC